MLSQPPEILAGLYNIRGHMRNPRGKTMTARHFHSRTQTGPKRARRAIQAGMADQSPMRMSPSVRKLSLAATVQSLAAVLATSLLPVKPSEKIVHSSS